MSKWRIFIVSLVLLTLLVTLISGCNKETTKEYTLTIQVNPSGGGTTSPVQGTYDYDDGTDVDVTATPAAGYVFDHWSGAATGDTSQATIIMDANKIVTAHFNTTVSYTLSVIVDPPHRGTVEISPSMDFYEPGTLVTLEATIYSSEESPEYTFDGWWLGDEELGVEESITITMDSNKYITAKFGCL